MDQGTSLEVAAARYEAAAAQPEVAPSEAAAVAAATTAGERGACRREKEALIDALINVLQSVNFSRKELISVLENVKVS